MLEFARGRPIEAGTNLPGRTGSAAWLLALPCPEPHRALCLGRPPEATLDALAGLGTEVIVVDGGRRPTQALPAGTFDLIWVDADGPTLARSAPFLSALTADGVVVVDRASSRPRSDMTWPGHGAGTDRGLPSLRLAATPRHGAARSLVPADDRTTRAFLAARGLSAAPRVPLVKHAGRGTERRIQALLRRGVLGPLHERTVVIAGAGVDSSRPPRYLRDLAATVGVDLDDHRWGLSATGRYPTQKALVLLFAGDAREPDVIVKASRFPIADRLVENETRVLRGLAAVRIAPGPRLPTVLFDGRGAGRPLVGEAAIDGRPFADRSTRRPDCPIAADAVEGLLRLGEETATEIAGGAAAEALGDVVRRFAALYPASAGRADWLLERLRATADLPLPAVAIHGDPGPQNLLVGVDGTVAFVDWENGDASGPPGWDVLHFVRSYATWSTRQRRGGSWLGTTVAHLAEGTAMTPFIAAALQACRRRLGVAPGWTEPLFFANLAYLAVNEAMRLPAERLTAGGYVRLIDRLYERRRSPVLRTLLASDEGPQSDRPGGDR